MYFPSFHDIEARKILDTGNVVYELEFEYKSRHGEYTDDLSELMAIDENFYVPTDITFSFRSVSESGFTFDVYRDDALVNYTFSNTMPVPEL